MSDIVENTAASAAMGSQSNDYHLLPATEKQLQFAHTIAQRTGRTLPWEAQQDRQTLSTWISKHKEASKSGQFSNYASSKQVAFAERIARMKRRTLPEACIRDRGLMSKWIDQNR